MIPVTANFISNYPMGMTIFVIPYGFLEHSLEESMRTKLQSKFGKQIRIVSYFGSDITNLSVPDALRSSLPHIMLLTIDAANSLFEHHPAMIRYWCNKNWLKGIYLDEVQTMIMENGFRSVYSCTKHFAIYGVPVIFLSGSYPKELIEPTMRHCGLITNDQTLEDIDSVVSNDLIGDNFDFTVVKTKGNGIVPTAKLVYEMVRTGAGAAHVICQSAKDANTMRGCCDKLFKSTNLKCAVVTSSDTKEYQIRIASAWYNGKYDVLISTTIGLVGNENTNVRFIFVHKQIYSTANLLQAIGRLRPEQRGKDTGVFQIITDQCTDPKNEWNKKLHIDADNLMQQIENIGILSHSTRAVFRKWFHIGEHQKLFLTEGCIMRNLSNLVGTSRKEPCGRCTWCKDGTRHILFENVNILNNSSKRPAVHAGTEPLRLSAPDVNLTIDDTLFSYYQDEGNKVSTCGQPMSKHVKSCTKQHDTVYMNPIQHAANETRKQTSQKAKEINSAYFNLNVLMDKCGLCNSVNCWGESCYRTGKCKNCGESHGTKECPTRSGNRGSEMNGWVIEKGHCFLCLCPSKFESHRGKDAVRKCTLDKRLVRMINALRGNKDYASFVKGILANTETFREFCSTLLLKNK